MMIPEELIEQYGGKKISYRKGEILFDKDTEAINYYQVASGQVKMSNYNLDGQEFIQGIFLKGQSFGEPALFGEFKYPASAVAVKDTKVYKLTKDHFFNLLEDNFHIHKKFNHELSKRLQYKGMILNEVSSHPPEHRLMTLMKYLKKKNSNDPNFIIPYTRQQLADMTGLRVETVIRTIKKMEIDKKLKIVDHKIVLEDNSTVFN